MSNTNRSLFATRVAKAALAVGVLMLGALGAATPARAQGAWCADYSGRGGTNCGFYTLQQCRWAVSGVGGTCRPSPYVVYDEPRPRRKVRRSR
jgi:hypothetical protein